MSKHVSITWMNIFNFLKLALAKIARKKIILIQVGGGLGDYIQARGYFRAVKEYHKNAVLCAILLQRNENFALYYDSKYVDCFFIFVSPMFPRKKELAVLKMFKYDVFIDFFSHIQAFSELVSNIRANKVYKKEDNEEIFIKDGYKKIMSNIIDIKDFKPNFDKIIKSKNLKDKDYILLVPKAYSAGSLSFEQVLSLVKYFASIKEEVMLLSADNEKPNIFELVHEKLNNEERKFLINGINTFETYELPDVVNNSKLVITPNTSIFHFALMMPDENKKIICLTPEFKEYIDYKKKNVTYLIKEKISNIKTDEIIKAVEKHLKQL